MRRWRGPTTGKTSPALLWVHLNAGWKMQKAFESVDVRLDGGVEATTKPAERVYLVLSLLFSKSHKRPSCANSATMLIWWNFSLCWETLRRPRWQSGWALRAKRVISATFLLCVVFCVQSGQIEKCRVRVCVQPVSQTTKRLFDSRLIWSQIADKRLQNNKDLSEVNTPA